MVGYIFSHFGLAILMFSHAFIHSCFVPIPIKFSGKDLAALEFTDLRPSQWSLNLCVLLYERESEKVGRVSKDMVLTFWKMNLGWDARRSLGVTDNLWLVNPDESCMGPRTEERLVKIHSTLVHSCWMLVNFSKQCVFLSGNYRMFLGAKYCLRWRYGLRRSAHFANHSSLLVLSPIYLCIIGLYSAWISHL